MLLDWRLTIEMEKKGEQKKRPLWEELRVLISVTETQQAVWFPLGVVLWAFGTQQSRHQEQKAHPEPDSQASSQACCGCSGLTGDSQVTLAGPYIPGGRNNTGMSQPITR